ncbi:MAG: hypothetical protein DLM72_12560 [Candidatus Nitrosopolaris wilkensis]|nr:MAG: hypothetical protein DLM72_12560 [Candidatus Nitrosopolaris wilkensis]
MFFLIGQKAMVKNCPCGKKGENKNQIAAYKDDKGELHTYSAVCTHLGCTVTWNPVEKSFDCPCHGSRFSASKGRVVNGPANSNLESRQYQGCNAPS